MTIPITPMSNKGLYRVETFTDMSAGSITKYQPIEDTGLEDYLRPALFIGDTVMHTNQGTMPLNFPIAAQSLAQAVDMFANSLRDKVEELESNITRSRILNGGSIDLNNSIKNVIKGN